MKSNLLQEAIIFPCHKSRSMKFKDTVEDRKQSFPESKWLITWEDIVEYRCNAIKFPIISCNTVGCSSSWKFVSYFQNLQTYSCTQVFFPEFLNLSIVLAGQYCYFTTILDSPKKHHTSFCLNIGCNDSLKAWVEAPILEDCAWARASLREYGWLGELSCELTLCHKYPFSGVPWGCINCRFSVHGPMTAKE